MRISRSRSKPLWLAILCLLVLNFFHQQRRRILATSIVPDIPAMDLGLLIIQRQKDFWKSLHPIIESHNPNCTYPGRLGDVGAVVYDPNTNLQRPSMTVMDGKAQRAMKEAHSSFITGIKAARTHIPPVSRPGTRGVVTSAGGNYLPVLVPSLCMLRRTGSTLRVEVL